MQFTIKQARMHAGFTQSKMADILGIDRSTYIKIEKNADRATVKQIRTVAQVTGIPATDIFLSSNSTLVDFGGKDEPKGDG